MTYKRALDGRGRSANEASGEKSDRRPDHHRGNRDHERCHFTTPEATRGPKRATESLVRNMRTSQVSKFAGVTRTNKSLRRPKRRAGDTGRMARHVGRQHKSNRALHRSDREFSWPHR